MQIKQGLQINKMHFQYKQVSLMLTVLITQTLDIQRNSPSIYKTLLLIAAQVLILEHYWNYQHNYLKKKKELCSCLNLTNKQTTNRQYKNILNVSILMLWADTCWVLCQSTQATEQRHNNLPWCESSGCLCACVYPWVTAK